MANGSLLIVLAGMCWGTSGTAGSFAPPGASALSIGEVRLLVAAIPLLVLLFWREGFRLRGPWPWGSLFLAAGGALSFQVLFFAAIRFTGVGIGTMIVVGSAPCLGGILGRVIYQEKLPRVWFTAAALSIAGCVLLGLGAPDGGGAGASEGFGFLLGIVLAFMGGLCFVLTGVGLKRLRQARGAFGSVTLMISCAALLGLPILFTNDFSWMLSARGALVSLALGVMSMGLPYVLFCAGLGHVKLGRAYVLGLTEPLTACLLSVFLLGEAMTKMMLLGIALVVIGIALLSLTVETA